MSRYAIRRDFYPVTEHDSDSTVWIYYILLDLVPDDRIAEERSIVSHVIVVVVYGSQRSAV